MIQRRKKYKNRTILGYKTLATGYISMAQVSIKKSSSKENMWMSFESTVIRTLKQMKHVLKNF